MGIDLHSSSHSGLSSRGGVHQAGKLAAGIPDVRGGTEDGQQKEHGQKEIGDMSIRSIMFCLVAVLAAMGSSGCARTPQAKAAGFIEKGNKQLEKKDYSRALLEFLNATRADP